MWDRPLSRTRYGEAFWRAHHEGWQRSEGNQLPSQIAKLNEPVDRSQKVIGRNVRFKRELVEQRSLIDLPMSHHDLQSRLSH